MLALRSCLSFSSILGAQSYASTDEQRIANSRYRLNRGMPMMNCAKHGWQGVELVTAAVTELLLARGGPGVREIVLLDLTWDEIEFPLAALGSELPLPGTELKDGALHTNDEEVFNAVLGTSQPVCARCLRALIGRADPSSDL